MANTTLTQTGAQVQAILDKADKLPSTLGTAGQVLTMNAGATAPEWQTPSGGGATINIYAANGNSSFPSCKFYYAYLANGTWSGLTEMNADTTINNVELIRFYVTRTAIDQFSTQNPDDGKYIEANYLSECLGYIGAGYNHMIYGGVMAAYYYYEFIPHKGINNDVRLIEYVD